MVIRTADPVRDAAACAAIYAPFVADSVTSFEEEPPDASELAGRIERVSRAYPWLVAEVDGAPAGFAYGSLHRERAAYRWACECSVYVDPAWHRRGIGRTLYTTLFELLARQGLQVVLAGITLPNEASVRLHESFGFELVGVYRRIGWKAGGWHDVGWWQLELTASGPEPPAEPGLPERLDRR